MNHNGCEKTKVCDKWKPKHHKAKEIFLECGDGAGFKTFTSPNDTPFQIAHVTVDTACLNKQEVLIKFSSLVKMSDVPQSNLATVRLQYELFRVCDGGVKTSLGTWMYENVNVNNIYFENLEESFNFIFCDHLNCQDCCDYFVTVTPLDIIESMATVINGRIAAVSQSPCYPLKKDKLTESQSKDLVSMQKNPVDKETLLECGKGTGGIIFNDTTDPASQIAYVNVDTTNLGKSNVLIDFSSIINFGIGSESMLLKFELFRVCEGGQPISRGTWRFELSRVIGQFQSIEVDESFGFIFCDSIVCPCQYEYFVMVSVVDVLRANSNNQVLVYNGRISALVQTLKKCHNYYSCEKGGIKSQQVDCQLKDIEPREILLECSNRNEEKTFTSESEQSPLRLANVSIDTSRLIKPKVNIEFSSSVSFENLGAGDGTLRYELIRVCNDNKIQKTLGVWSIGRKDFFNIDKATNIFDFTFCDFIGCLSCCEYIVTVTPIGFSRFSATVGRSSIAALAQSSYV